MINSALELHPAWADRFNNADIDGMLALSEPGAAFVPQPGVVTTGDDAREALAGFLSLGLPINLMLRHHIEADDIALLIYDWTIRGTAADGSEVDLSGSTSDVVRRGDNGWMIVIDNPFGTA